MMEVTEARISRRWKTLTACLVTAVCFTLLLSGAVAWAQTFSDVQGDEYFATALGKLSEEGVIQGRDDGSFGATGTVNRAQLAAFLARVLDLAPGETVPFADMTAGDWFYGDVAALYEAGIVQGTSATEYSPFREVSRQQAATFVVRALTFAVQRDTGEDPYVLGAELVPSWLGGYADRAFIAVAHQASVANAYRLGIMSGTAEGWFFPDLSLNRGQMAVTLFRAFYQPVAVATDYPQEVDAGFYGTLSSGSRGALVLLLETRLVALHYPCGSVDEVYDYRTRDAVLAFEKVERLARDGMVGPTVWTRLFSAQIPTPRYVLGGDRAEVDLTRQVLFMMKNGEVAEVVHVSTGKLGTPTGRGKVFRKDQGWVTVPVGQMYSPSYIMPHIAIHGSKSVPTYPASHGCVRTPIWITDHLYSELPMGFQVDVYY
jgi:N-acetylmuramoyl-L-alanine amidase